MNEHQAQEPEKNAAIAAARRKLLDAYRHVFSSPAGDLILAHLRSAAATSHPAYTPGGNVNDALWRDGRKSIVLEIENHIRQAAIEFGKSQPADKPPATGRRSTRRKSG